MTPLALPQKIVFMGTPDFAVPSLWALAKAHDLRAVYTQPPRPSGRGMKTHLSPIHQAAADLGVEIRTPLSFGLDENAALSALKPDLLVVVAYGMILPQAVLDIPKIMAINGHASILPRWRGAAPIHRAIAAGDANTGVTLMKMKAGLDTGDMLKVEKTDISDDDTNGSLHDRLAEMTARLLTQTIPSLDTITPIRQDEAAVTWADKITADEGEVDFTQKLAVIDCKIRATTPRPGSWIALEMGDDGRLVRLKIKAAVMHYHGNPSGQPTGVYLGRGTPQCGAMIAAADGAVELTHVQPQGKPVMTARDFLNGYAMPPQIKHSTVLLGD